MSYVAKDVEVRDFLLLDTCVGKSYLCGSTYECSYDIKKRNHLVIGGACQGHMTHCVVVRI